MRKRSYADQQESERGKETTKQMKTTELPSITQQDGHINFFSDLQTGVR